MTRKKTLYVITKSNWGGAQRYVYDLATNLPKDRFEVAVACGKSGLLVEKLNAAEVKVIPIPHLQRNINIFKELISFWGLFKIFRREKPDLIHLNSSKVGGLGAIAAKLSSFVIRHSSFVIFTVHGWGFNEDRPWWQKKVIFFLSWLSALFQDKIILIDTPDFETAKKFIAPKKLALVPNGIREPEFLPREEARKFFSEKIRKELPENTLIIGTIAELTKNKGLNYFIEAVNKLKYQIPDTRYQILIIGDGEERNNLTQHIKSLNLENKIHLLGFIPESAKYLKGFDIFVLPSLKEGLPYTIIEAMAAGLPVVATDAGGVKDLVKDGRSGLLVKPKSAQGLENTLSELLNNAGKRNSFGEEGKKIFRSKFYLDGMLKKVLTLYLDEKK